MGGKCRIQYNRARESQLDAIADPLVAIVALVAGIVFAYRRLIPVNPTTVALTLLLAVLVVSHDGDCATRSFSQCWRRWRLTSFFCLRLASLPSPIRRIGSAVGFSGHGSDCQAAVGTGEARNRQRQSAPARCRAAVCIQPALAGYGQRGELLNAIPSHVCQVFSDEIRGRVFAGLARNLSLRSSAGRTQQRGPDQREEQPRRTRDREECHQREHSRRCASAPGSQGPLE